MANQPLYYVVKNKDAQLDNVDVSGDLSVTGTFTASGVSQTLQASLAYTDTTAKVLFTIPAGAIITGWTINVTELFDSDGTDLVDIGITGTAEKFAANVDVSTAGLKTTGVVAAQVGVVQATAQAVLGIYAAGGSAATQGAAIIIVNYYIPAS